MWQICTNLQPCLSYSNFFIVKVEVLNNDFLATISISLPYFVAATSTGGSYCITLFKKVLDGATYFVPYALLEMAPVILRAR